MAKRKGTALVTGAAKRLGREVAMFLAREGYAIALHYHTSKREAMSAAQALHKAGARCELFSCDLADERQTLRLIGDVHRSFPDLNVLVNNASIFMPNQFGAQDLTLFNMHWNVNFRAPYILSCEFARLAREGLIINFIDTNAVKYKTRFADYLLTKKALGDFTRMAAVQWGPSIRVNGISPGMILPPVNNQPDDRPKRAGQIPLKRVGDPACIIQTVRFLLNNTYVTGQIIANDGGENLV